MYMLLDDEIFRPEHRHFYEIIREGNPCKLYFDLEYSVEFNPRQDGDRGLKTFLTVLNAAVVDTFGFSYVHVPRLMMNSIVNCVVDLISDNPKKFSHHIIIRYGRSR